jgi:hypothetical protein
VIAVVAAVQSAIALINAQKTALAVVAHKFIILFKFI